MRPFRLTLCSRSFSRRGLDLLPASRTAAFAAWSASILLALASPSAAVDNWQASDGPYGGTIRALAVDPNNGALYAARSQDLHRSTDDGATWTQLGANTSMSNILDVSVGQNGVILVGVSTRGAWWSFDGGLTWDNDQITSNPHSGTGATLPAVIVAPGGALIGGGFRSANGGASWTQMNLSGNDFALDPSGAVLAATQTGVHRSTNQGISWIPRNSGIETVGMGHVAVASDGTLFAGSYSTGVFRSTDAGASWAPANLGLTDLVVQALVTTPSSEIFVATNDGLFISLDNGNSWTATPSPLPTSTALDLAPHPTLGLAAGTNGLGVWSSADAGAAWIPRHHGMSVSYPEAIVRTTAGTLLLADFEAGVVRATSAAGPWAGSGAGLTTGLRALKASEDGPIYAGAWNGAYVSLDDGSTWNAAGTDLAGQQIRALLVVEDAAAHTVIALANEPSNSVTVQRSFDGGNSWQLVLDPAAQPAPSFLEHAASAADGWIYAGGLSILGSGVVFASSDLGETWEEHLLSSVFGFLGFLETGPAGELYTATTNSPTIYRSEDHGASFAALPPGPWGSAIVAAIEATPDGRVFAGTSTEGVFVLEGGSWSAYSRGLPSVGGNPGMSAFLELIDSTLFAGISNEGLYWNAEPSPSSAPDGGPPGSLDATRVTVAAAPNPFSGETALTFRLPQRSRVEVDVFDAAGRVVRHMATGELGAGTHRVAWDGRTNAGVAVSSGAYFARVRTAGATETVQVFVLR